LLDVIRKLKCSYQFPKVLEGFLVTDHVGSLLVLWSCCILIDYVKTVDLPLMYAFANARSHIGKEFNRCLICNIPWISKDYPVCIRLNAMIVCTLTRPS
jgi:hypothetical protein